MARSFTPAQWSRINGFTDWSDFGLPHRRTKSVTIGTFNIRKLGAVKNRSEGAWGISGVWWYLTSRVGRLIRLS